MRVRGACRIAAAVIAAVAIIPSGRAAADETTIGYGVARSNWDAAEPGLTVAAISQPDFGQLWSATLPRPAGQDATSYPNASYAQPLVVGGVVIVVTEENQVDAIDAQTGALKWSVALGPAWAPTLSCGDISPRIGITSTPVYDPATGTIYTIAKTDDGPDASHPNLRMHALHVTDGSEVPGWPIKIAGVGANSGLPFNPTTANQRAGLLLLGGSVYFATASHCDRGPYVGWVGGVNTAGTPQVTLWSSESTSGTNEAGIWQSGGGIVSDGPGRLFVATGNGVSPPPGPGSSPPGTLAESVVRLGVGAGGVLSAKDFFSPANNAKLDQDDADLGSGGPVPLPDSYGSSTHPHLLEITGKDGIVRLLDRDALGGTAQGPGGTDAVVSALTLKGVWGRAAVFDAGADHYLYLLPSSSPLHALRVAPDAAGNPTLSVVAASVDSYGYTSGSPVVTSDGANAASAVVWVVTVNGGAGTGAMLRAFPAVPPIGGNWRPVASFPLGTVAKFVQPATDGGRVFVATRDGRVLAFGRPTTAAISAPPTDFGLVPVGGNAMRTLTITAHAPVTLDGIEAAAPFSAGSPIPALPATLAAGDKVTMPVTFAPTTPDTTSDVLTVHTHNAATGATFDYLFALTGTGTQDGVAASPAALDFGSVVTGTARQLGVTIRNTGTTDATVTGVSAPAAPFTAVSAPAPGFVLPPQGSVTVTLRFAPTSAEPATGTLGVSTDTGSVVVPVQGLGIAGAPHLSMSTGLAFGNVAPGSPRTLTMIVRNTGTAPMTIEKAAPPAAPFVVATPVNEGQQLAPGDSLTVPITVRPRTAMPLRDRYSVTADDGQGARNVPLTANLDPWVGPVRSRYGCIDVWSDARVRGAETDLFTCNGSPAQQIAFGSSGTLRVGAATSSWCLGAKGGRTAAGTPIQLFVCDGSSGQAFRWTAASRLVNPASGRCIAPRAGAPDLGTPLVLATCDTTAAQRWDASALVATRGETSSLLGAASQICLADPGASRTSGTQLVIQRCRTTVGQIITHTGTRLRIVGQCLAAGASKPVAHTSASITSCTGAASQAFTVRSDGRVQNTATDLCLTVRYGHTTPGTPVWLTGCATSAAQRWRLPG
jgi:hypothetical protein